MTKPTVYLETTVIGHLVGRIHPDSVVAGRQLVTRQWWESDANRFQLFVSEVVINECSDGDAHAAAERLAVLKSLELLDLVPEAKQLAIRLITSNAIPAKEVRDATHISLAAVHGIEYLVTWNFKHIANHSTRTLIESVCGQAGYLSPNICTPFDLLE